MATPTAQQVWSDPDFIQLHPAEKAKVMQKIDPDFAGLPPVEQNKVIFQLTGRMANMPKRTAEASPESQMVPGSDHDQQQAAFLANEGTIGTRLRESLPSRKTLATIARPVLEGAGVVGGGIVGGTSGLLAGLGVGAIPGTVAGAALGYAGGKNLADQIEGDTPQTWSEAAHRTLSDLGTGAAIEMVGQGAGKVIGYGVNKALQAKNAVMRSTPSVTKEGIRGKAGQILAENMGDAPVYARNSEEAAKLRVPGYKPSIGEARNDPGLIKLQRGIERQTGTAANTILEQKAANQTAIRDYLDNQFTGNESIDDVITALSKKKAQIETATKSAESGATAARNALNPADPQTIGRNISETIDTAISPVKTAEREAWAKVPNYPVPTPNLTEVSTTLKNTPMVKSTESVVNEILDYAARMPKTTEGLQSIERTINDKMFAANADPNVKRVLGSLKKAVNDDFSAMGAASESGDIALHNGEIVYPSKLQTDRDSLVKRLSEISAKSEPDYAAMQKQLRENGVSPAMFDRADKYDTTWQKRTTDQYTKKISADIPKITTAKPGEVENIQSGIDLIDKKLAEMQPAKDISAAYRAAKDVSKERFDRFGKGAMNDITRPGNQPSGLKMPDSAIPAKVFSMDGADSFIRAVGKDTAATHADQYAAQELLSKANPLTGELNTKTVASWIQKNMPVLRKYGISTKYLTVAKAQAAAEIARASEMEFTKSAASKILGSDVDKAMTSAFSTNPQNTASVVKDLLGKIGNDPQGIKGLQNSFKDFIITKAETTAKTINGENIISPAAVQKTLVKYAPAMRELYRAEPGKIAALNKVSKAVEIQSRSARSPVGGGSDTAENLNVAQSILAKVVHMVPGGGMAVSLGKAGLGALSNLNAGEINKVIAKALYDPELAQTLILASRRSKPGIVAKRINDHLITLGITGNRDAINSHLISLGIIGIKDADKNRE